MTPQKTASAPIRLYHHGWPAPRPISPLRRFFTMVLEAIVDAGSYDPRASRFTAATPIVNPLPPKADDLGTVTRRQAKIARRAALRARDEAVHGNRRLRERLLYAARISPEMAEIVVERSRAA